MNIEIIKELVGYDISTFDDKDLNLINMEVMREVAATIESSASADSPNANAQFLQAILTVANSLSLNATVEAYYKKEDTVAITKLNGEGTVYEGTIYTGKTFWYKITITNPNDSAAQSVKLMVPQPTGVRFADASETSYEINGTPGSTPITFDNSTMIIGGAEPSEPGGTSDDDIPAKAEDNDGVLVAWIKATVTANA